MNFLGLSLRGAVAVCSIALTLDCASAAANASDYHPAVTVLQDDITFDVNADSTSTEDQVRSVRIETDQGVKQDGQITYRYSNSREKLAVIEAYTTTRDGTRLEVPANAILVRQSATSAYAPTFDDGRVTTIVFPGVETGATLTMHVLRTELAPLFPGQFSLSVSFLNDKTIKSANVTVHAPETLKLYTDAIAIQGGRLTSSHGKQTWQWSLKDAPAQQPELNAPSMEDHSPRLVVTTFPNYEAVGLAYQARARPKTAVTPAVQELADKVTMGIDDRRDQAAALYRWVSTHVRYVAIFLGFGGVVPHSAQEVLDTRYGDCKDHTTLFESLLAAKGIKSSTVLVNGGNHYWLPGAADPLAAFDHAITYIPEFELYADSTAGTARFGTLPSSEEGKSALITDDGNGQPRLVTLPTSSPDTNRMTIRTDVVFDPEGTARGTSEIDTQGESDWVARTIFESIPSGFEDQVAQQLLSQSGTEGSGRFIYGDIKDLKEPFSYSTTFEIPDYAEFSGAGAIRVPRGLNSFSSIGNLFEFQESATRKTPFLLTGRHISEITTIELPAATKISSVPKPVAISSSFGTYASSYVVDGQKITVIRTLDLTLKKPYVAPDEYAELRRMGQAIKHDLASQIVY